MDYPNGYFGDYEESPRTLPLVVMIAILVGSGLFLHAIAGAPHLPSRIPSWAEVLVTLQGSDVPLEWFAYAFTTAAWLIWIWTVASLLLQLITALAEFFTRGAAWALGLRAAIDRVTFPIVRRAVDGAVVAVVVVNLLTRAPAASAAPLDSPPVLVANTPQPRPDPPRHHPSRQVAPASRTVEYTVKPGDTLWSISEHFYGTGEEYPRLVDANASRRMSDGNVFTRAGVIQPGWVLRVPLPSTATRSVGGQTIYTVEKGDTLRGIAARFLGDEDRWPAIFDLNRGKAHLADGRVLNNPDLIWPELNLRLPPQETDSRLPATAPAPTQPIAVPSGAAAPSRPATPAPVSTVPSTPTTPIATPSAAMPTPIVNLRPAAPTSVAPSPSMRTASPLESPVVDGAMVAGAAIAAGVALLVSQARRSLDEPADESTPPPITLCNDFAETDLDRTLAHRLECGEIEPVEVVATQAHRFLRERGVADAAILLARQGPKATTLLVEMDLLDDDAIAELADELGVRLGGRGRARITPERDVVLALSDLKLATLALPTIAPPLDRPLLVPVGLLDRGETLYLSWDELGHVLIAAQPGEGANVVLTTVLAGLVARRRPDELRLMTIARQRGLPPQVAHLPHQTEVVDLDDSEEVARVLRMARAELFRRMARDEDEKSWRPTREQPPMVIAIEELADVEDDGTTLELLGSRGVSHGIVLLAATTHVDELADDNLGHFTTRIVLQTLDDAASIRLLGRPDAVDLGGAEIVVRVAGRTPLRARGFRIPDAHLDAMLTRLRSAYGGRRSASVVPPTSDQVEPTMDDDQRHLDGSAQLISDESSTDEMITTDVAPLVVPDEVGDVAEWTDETVETVANAEGSSITELVPTEACDAVLMEPGLIIDAVEPSSVGLSMNGPTANGTVVISRPEPNEPTTTPAEDSSDESTLVDAPVDDVSDRRHAIQVRCFERFRVTSGDRELTPSLGGRSCFKAWELLALLATRPDGSMPKDQIIAALWPDTDIENATQSLHTAASRLRRSLRAQVPDLDDNVVGSGRDGTYRLDPALVWSDSQCFASLCARAPKLLREQAIAILHQARRLYRGELLADQSFKWPAQRYAGVVLRAYYADMYRQATCRMARLLCEEGHPARAAALYKGLLKIEPTLEDVVRGLYRCYQQQGDLASLLRADQELRQALRESFGDKKIDAGACDPSATTQDLFRQIRSELEARARAAKNGHAPTLTGKVAKRW